MNSFAGYAHYYDLLYRDKDYTAEAAFVVDTLSRHLPGDRGPISLIELGCGTGRHAALIAEQGAEVLGIDSSDGMIAEARSRRAALSEPLAGRLRFEKGDIRSYRDGVRPQGGADAAVSLFHVFSYQTANSDLHATLETVRHHVRPGGILLFDCWYGPAVLTDRPSVRVKRMEDDTIRIARIAEPEWHPNENRVDVRYQVLITDRADGHTEELNELHRMRYLFLPEIELLTQAHGMRVLESGEWMTRRAIGADSWNAYFVVRVGDHAG